MENFDKKLLIEYYNDIESTLSMPGHVECELMSPDLDCVSCIQFKLTVSTEYLNYAHATDLDAFQQFIEGKLKSSLIIGKIEQIEEEISPKTVSICYQLSM